ncbi:MAG: alpha-N-arabinofuranosidase [Chitinophagaceae bacterium]|nr:MAG: alpha-N-arabinofuranosidase [Chitinophagaceae bacterium]
MKQLTKPTFYFATAVVAFTLFSCGENQSATAANNDSSQTAKADTNGKKYLSQPLVTHIYTADPSAHVFNNRIYIYPSHDTATGTPEDDLGSHFFANGKYYLYFPVKNKQDVFQIGVATSDKPEGPFTAEKEPIKGSYSMDPCVFKDDDGSYYMYFGGIWGGQLQRWGGNNQYDSTKGNRKPEEQAVLPRMAKLNADMKSFATPVKEVRLVDGNGKTFTEKDNDKRFFEAAWMHKYNGKYYFSYSTGDTHNICYAIGDSPNGPFTYKGIILKPVKGWTNHHSIIQHNGKWWLFYHDVQLSGKTHLRNVKVTELHYNPDGTIQPINPML